MHKSIKGVVFSILAAAFTAVSALFYLLGFADFFGGLKLYAEIFLAASGLLFIFAFIQGMKTYFKPGWILMQGFLFVFISMTFIFLDSQSFDNDLLKTVFGIAAIATSAVQISSGIQLSTLEVRRWKLPVLCGIINLLIAFVLILSLIKFENSVTVFSSVYLFSVSVDTILDLAVKRG